MAPTELLNLWDTRKLRMPFHWPVLALCEVAVSWGMTEGFTYSFLAGVDLGPGTSTPTLWAFPRESSRGRVLSLKGAAC